MAAHVQSIFDALHDAGLTVTPKPNGGLNVAPSSRLTDELRELVRSGKADMLRWFAMRRQMNFQSPRRSLQHGLNYRRRTTGTTSPARPALLLARGTGCAAVSVHPYGGGTQNDERHH